MTTISKINVLSHHTTVYLQLKLHHQNQKQTDDIDIEFAKVFTDYIKNKQHQNSQKKQIQYSQTMFFQSSIAIYP